MSYNAKGNPFYIVSYLNYNHMKNERFLYIPSVNAFHSGYHAVPLTNRKHVIYILDKAHTKCKNIMTNEVITK
jgi:hypothetical protein